MAIGRISGSVLKSNLTRNGVDLAFETNLLYLDVTNSRVGIGTSEPTSALHVNGNTTVTGALNISGALTVGSFSPDTISVNNLYSTDSTAIQINDGVNVSGTLTANTFITNEISSSESSAIQVNDGMNVSGSLTANTLASSGATLTGGTINNMAIGATTATTGAFTDVVLNQLSSADSTAIQINDGVNVSGTLTANTFITNEISSSESSAIQINDAVNISGTLTANTFVTNSIVSTSNGNITIDPAGSGIIEVAASIIPQTNLTVSLGTPLKRFSDAYFGAGTLYIGDESISSSNEGLVFSAPISIEGGLTQISDDTSATIISATKIGNSATTVHSFDTEDYDSALYYITTLDESNNKIEVNKISLCHDTASSYMSQTGTVTSDTNSVHTYSTDLSGGVKLQLTGSSAVNSMTAYQLTLGDNSSADTNGHTAVVTPGTISGSSTTAIDSWSAATYRAVKYFVSVKNTVTKEVNNIEAIVLHNGSSADITSYNIVKTGSGDLCTLSVSYSSGTVTLYAVPNNSQTLRVKLHKISLSDSESVVNYDNVYIISSKTISGSDYTVIDTVEDTKINGAVYFVTSTNTTDGLYTASEVYVTTNSTDSFIVHGPELSIAGRIYFTASKSGNKVILKAYTTGSSSTIINAYRIGMYRFEQGGDFAQSVTLDTAQTIAGAKKFTLPIALTVGSDPAGVADNAHIYAKDFASSAEVYVRDEAGNVTKISPHNPQGEWEYYSRNTRTGKTVRVNMEEMIRDIEKITGKKYIKNE